MSRLDTTEQSWEFEGFANPGMTQIPDEFFDLLAPRLKEAELRVMLYIMRRTFGFKKSSDDISLRQMVEGIKTKEGKQLDHGTGLSKPAVIRAVKSLVERRIIIATSRRSAEKGDEATTYTLHFKYESLPDTVLTKVTRGGNARLQGGVNEVNPQDTVEQDTVRQETVDIRNWKDTATRKRAQAPKASANRHSPPEENRQEHSTPPPSLTLTQASSLGFSTLGDVLATHQLQRPIVSDGQAESPSTEARPPRRGKRINAPQSIKTFIRDVSGEFHDESHVASNLSQAVHLWQESGFSEAAFLSTLYTARSITKQSNVTKPATNPALHGLKNKMPYFWAVVRDELGLGERSHTQPNSPP